jgi:DNA-binding HxlR family transcriptional regulator
MTVVATRRSYRQFCGLAAALDVVGERWTMLLVRDLALGARRYGELLEGLPGIGEGLLAQRLRHLEAEGIARRTFSQAHGAVVYELTEDGMALFEALVPLTAWGLKRVDLDDDEGVKADWLAVALRARLDPLQTSGVEERYAFWVDDEPFTIAVGDETIAVERGEPEDPALRVDIDLDALMQIGAGAMSITEAREAGRTTISGDPKAISRYARLWTGIRR